MKKTIEKAPGAKTNSFVTEIKGMSANPATLKIQNVNASVMFTSDERGETLSVFDPTTKKQIILPFEQFDANSGHTPRGFLTYNLRGVGIGTIVDYMTKRRDVI